MRLCLLFLLALLQLPLLAAEAPRFCADDAQWPPFSYTSGTNKLEGMTIDLIQRTFAPYGIDVQIDQLPWKRCLAAIEQGDDYQVAIDASASDERRSRYLLTRPYYELTPYYFYSRRQFPGGIRVSRGVELGRFGRLCGLPGYNYSNFALGQTEIYTGAKDFYALAEMAHRGRCALFIGRYEIVAGMARLGPDLLADPDIAFAPIPDALKEPFHMLISRNFEDALALKETLDQAILRMQHNGELRQLQQTYLPDRGFSKQ